MTPRTKAVLADRLSDRSWDGPRPMLRRSSLIQPSPVDLTNRRPKSSLGSPKRFFQLLAADYDAGGREVIEKVRQRYPLQYLRLIVSLLPKRRETRHTPMPVEKLSDEELARLILETRQLLAKLVSNER